MATARLTLGTVLGTVVSAAETVTTTLEAVNNSVGMANAYVTKARMEQRGRHLNDAKLFTRQLVIEGSEMLSEMNLHVVAYCKKSPEHKKLFEQAYEEFAELHGLKLKAEDDTTIMKFHAAE